MFGLVTVWEFVSVYEFVSVVIVKLCLVWLPFGNLSAKASQQVTVLEFVSVCCVVFMASQQSFVVLCSNVL